MTFCLWRCCDFSWLETFVKHTFFLQVTMCFTFLTSSISAKFFVECHVRTRQFFQPFKDYFGGEEEGGTQGGGSLHWYFPLIPIFHFLERGKYNLALLCHSLFKFKFISPLTVATKRMTNGYFDLPGNLSVTSDPLIKRNFLDVTLVYDYDPKSCDGGQTCYMYV